MENSPLGRLPGEIRNIIYEYVLRVEDHVQIRLDPDHRSVVFPKLKTRPKCTVRASTSATRASAQLFKVCRMMRAETRGLYFTLNDLHITAADWSLYVVKEALIGWLQTIGDHPQQIRPKAITLHLGSAHMNYPRWGLIQDIFTAFHPGVQHKVIMLEPVWLRHPWFNPNLCRFKLIFGPNGHKTDTLDEWVAEQERTYRRSAGTYARYGMHLKFVENSLRRWINEMPHQQEGH